MIGKFKEENLGIPIKEIAAPKPKMYKFRLLEEIEGKIEKGTAKGIKSNVAKKLEMEQYKKVLTNKLTKDLNEIDLRNMKQEASFNLIRSTNHNLESINIIKTSLCSYENKRFYFDSINSNAFGHYKNIKN